MSFSLVEACRKRKRRPKVFKFHSFGDPGCPINPKGPFRDNIRLFLQECVELEDYCVQGMPLWCTLLIHEKSSFMFPLYTVEENVYQSLHPFCDHCRCAGWSGHFVSKRRYHFIIPNDDGWHKHLGDGDLDNQTHLLHGMIHCNGYGHLICINGIEGGSKLLSGREIMDLWDRICTNLRTSKITVEDSSKKRSMDLRLLYGVAYGHSWFGRWGYRFCRGSFGVTDNNYNKAIEVLGSLELDKLMQDFSEKNCNKEIKQITRYYRDMSETPLITVRDLLRFMLTVKSRTPAAKKVINFPSGPFSVCCPKNSTRNTLPKEKTARYKKFSTAVANMDSRWPARRLEYAAQVIVDALKENKAANPSSSGMTRQDVRDAARQHIGDTGLLDNVLKSLNNVLVGNCVVCRTVNPVTRILEYTIHDVENGFKVPEVESEAKVPVESPSKRTQVPGVDVYNDVAYLYKNVILDFPDTGPMEWAVQTVLDSRHFVKEWALHDEMEQLLTFICRLKPNFDDTRSQSDTDMAPGEIVSVPLHATVRDLKQAAEAALRDTYCIAERLMVTDIEELGRASDEELLFGVLQSGMELCVRGISIDLGTPLKYQGGADNWKVRCECGAQDDDGERMVACDICEVWQHTRCCGIEDSETVPPLFVCSGCCDSLVPPRIDCPLTMDYADMMIPTPSHVLEFGV
ncbi:hypothetical protein L6164_033068 [Bauhinia variegata]|uniref:Uncharacterized protein n=1 Tax=Bauhinia variegata TaxID=167791 RepID=A0ACB9KQU7_BAUVA|nr:hypothetical protein L6164_033068 [Bauhinia variegata]